MEEFCQKWSSLGITDEEEVVLNLDEEEVGLSAISLKDSLVGRLLCHKPYNKKALKSVMGSLWKTRGGLEISDLEDDVLLFKFKNPVDKARVLETGPWLFDRFLLVLFDPGDGGFNEESFKISESWVQLHGVPSLFRTAKMGEVIGKQIGQVVRIDKDREGRCKDNFIRLRLKFDVTKPLRRGVHIKFGVNVEPTWVELKYEKLADLCFFCGRLGHGWRACTVEGARVGDSIAE